MYDFQYELEGGEGTRYEVSDFQIIVGKANDSLSRNKIVFISWSPDEGTLVFVS